MEHRSTLSPPRARCFPAVDRRHGRLRSPRSARSPDETDLIDASNSIWRAFPEARLAAGVRQPPTHRPETRHERHAPQNRCTGPRRNRARRRQMTWQSIALAEANRRYERRSAESSSSAQRQDVARDSQHPRIAHEERRRDGAPRGRRTTTSDHAASPSPLAGVQTNHGHLNTHSRHGSRPSCLGSPRHAARE